MSELSFSVHLQMQIDQFQANLQQARNQFTSVTEQISNHASQLTANSTTASQALAQIFSSPNDNLTQSIRQAVTSLDGLTAGANISEEQLQQAFTTSSRHLDTLNNDLTQARQRLAQLQLSGGTVAELFDARNAVQQLENQVEQAQNASNELGRAMSDAMNRATQTTQSTTASIERLLGVRSNNTIESEMRAIENAMRQLETQTGGNTAEFQRFQQVANARLQSLQNELNNTNNTINRTENESRQLGNTINKLGGAFNGLTGLLATLGVGVGIAEIVQMADEFKNLEARIKLATAQGQDWQIAFKGVTEVANATYTSIADTAELYGKLARVGNDMGMSQQKMLDLTTTINQAVQLSGASTEQAQAGIMQMSQALMGGTIRAEEYNSMMENTPTVLTAVAEGLGMSMGTLRQHMLDGKLSAEEFLQAIEKQAGKIEQDFNTMPTTVSNAVTVLKNNFLSLIGDIDKTLQGSSDLSNGILALAGHLKNLDPIMVQTVQTFFTQLLGTLKEFGSLVVEVWDSINGLFSAVTGSADSTSEKVNILTSSLQGVTIILGIITDGIKAIEIGFNLATGASSFFMSGLLNFIEKFTWGDVSTGLKELSANLMDMSVNSFNKAEKSALNFKLSAEKALQELSKTSAEKMAETAEKSRLAYEKMATDGKASSEIQKQAFIQMATDQINANNGVIDERLKYQLIEQGLRAEISKTGEVAITSMTEVAKVGNLTEAELKKAKDATDELAKSLGIGATAEVVKLQDSIVKLSENFDSLRAGGVNAGALMSVALDEVNEKAKNVDDIKVAINLWQQMGEQGKITGEDLKNGLQTAHDKLDEMTDGINSVREAFKVLGLVSREEMAKKAEDYKTAYEMIANSGTATAKQLEEAFKKYATAQIESNDGVVDSTLKAQAQQRGLAISVDSTGNIVVKKQSEMTNATNITTQATDNLTSSASRIGDGVSVGVNRSIGELERLNQALDSTARRNAEISKKSEAERLDRDNRRNASQSSNLSTRTGVENFLKQAGMNEAQAKEKARSFATTANGLNIDWHNILKSVNSNANLSSYLSPSMYLLKMAETMKYQDKRVLGGQVVGERVLPAPIKVSESVPTISTPKEVINVNFVLGEKRVVMTAPANQSNDLKNILNQLQESKWITGR